jgi:hypothetical protein
MEGSLVAYKVFTNGSTLQASELNENLMQQATAVFSNAAARTAAITSPVEGQLTYLEDTNSYQHWDGSAWTSPFGLTLVKTQNIGTAVSSIIVSDAFTSEFDNYKILISGGFGSTTNIYLRLTLDSVNTGYFSGLIFTSYAASVTGSIGTNNGASFAFGGVANGTTIGADINLTNVSITEQTRVLSQFSDDSAAGVFSGFCTSTAAHTSFTLTCSTGTITGGTIRVYGYRNTL